MTDINLTSGTSGFLEDDFNQIKDLLQDGTVNAVSLGVTGAITGGGLTITGSDAITFTNDTSRTLNVDTTADGAPAARFRNTFAGDTTCYSSICDPDNAAGSTYFYRNLSSTATAGTVFTIRNLNASDDQQALLIRQDAAATALDIEHDNAAGYGLDIDAYAGENSYAGIRVQCITTSGYCLFMQKNVETSTVPVAHFLQNHTGGAIPVIELKQDDTSEGFINFVGSDTGSVATQSGASDASITVELNGTKYKIPLFSV